MIVPFFNRLAHEKSFHPTKESEQWYNVKKSDIVQYKVLKLPDFLLRKLILMLPLWFSIVTIFLEWRAHLGFVS